MSRRLAACALAALASAGLASSSSADVGPGGWGIADDMWVPRITLDDTFDELEPKSFRLIAAWDRLHDPAYRSEIQSKIAEANAAARTPGGMEIAVSFSVPPQTWQGLPLTGQAWLDQVAPFIARFTPDVEWWSPMNEPGLRGWTFTPAGAQAVADFSIRLRDHLQQLHPADRQLSPDFNDHYNADGTLKRHPDGTSFVERYVKHFHNAGGHFGEMVSWHAHAGVRHTSALSTDDLIEVLGETSGAALPIWITEAGSPVNDTRAPGQTEEQQEAQVRFLADTATGLAARDQVTRISYYHMRQEPDPFAPTCTAKAGFPWDTGLVRVCGEKRPAWYVWCLASRQRDGACYDDSPGVASWSSTRIDVFWRGNGDDAATYTRSWEGSSRAGPWSSVSSHGSATNSSPAVIAPAARRLEIYTRGANNAVQHRRYNGSSWSAWSGIGGLTYASPAASARRGTSIVDVFIRGTDNAIHHRSRNGNTWSSAWTSIGAPPGGATSAPATVSNANGRTELFVRGADGGIWRRIRTSSWGSWTSLGGTATSAPAATSRGTNRVDLFARGADGQVMHRSTSGGAWSAWTALGGGATLSAPAAVAPSSGRIDLWARGATGALQHRVWRSASGWSAWSASWHQGPRP